MFSDATSTTLSSHKRFLVSSTTSKIEGSLGVTKSHDMYRIRLTSRSESNLISKSSRANADIELIQDMNGNRLLDSGEIVASSRAPRTLRDLISMTGLDPGTYFLRVLAVENSQSQFQYHLSTRAKPNQDKSEAYKVVELINKERIRRGLHPLAVNTQLSRAAQKHKENMAVQDFFDHTGLDGSSPTTRMFAEGYNSYGAAENIFCWAIECEQNNRRLDE